MVKISLRERVVFARFSRRLVWRLEGPQEVKNVNDGRKGRWKLKGSLWKLGTKICGPIYGKLTALQ